MHVTDLKSDLVLNRKWLLILIFNSKSYNLPSVIDVLLGWEAVALFPRMSSLAKIYYNREKKNA